MPSDLDVILLLNTVPGVGAVRIAELCAKVSDLSSIFGFSEAQWCALGFSAPWVSKLLPWIAKPNWDRVARQKQQARTTGAQLVALTDARYPPLLKEIYDPPPVLYIHGDPAVLSLPQCAVVGTRRPTDYGRAQASAWARDLVEAGYVITSGFAYGIDIIAHRTAYSLKAPTVVVLGTSLDQIYPPQHRTYVPEILEAGGAIVSEFPYSTPVKPQHFPRRNRVISGLSHGVVVIEAALKSGSLITARMALEQNREVFAVPGHIHNPYAAGCHALIQQGAKLIVGVNDILNELPVLDAGENAPAVAQAVETVQNAALEGLDPAQVRLLACMGKGLVDFDTIVLRGPFSPQWVAAELITLELLGRVQSLPGGYRIIANNWLVD
jgi:DNA processing protein